MGVNVSGAIVLGQSTRGHLVRDQLTWTRAYVQRDLTMGAIVRGAIDQGAFDQGAIDLDQCI